MSWGGCGGSLSGVYEILTLDRTENRIELNVTKLKRQFDLE
jgi:hypothetical protein